jgi:ATP synthase protein I
VKGAGLFIEIRRILLLQAALVAILGGAALILGGVDQARSAALGGLTGFLPNLAFAFGAGRDRPGRSAREVLNAFYLGEAVKLALTVLLFIIVFQLPNIVFLPLFAGFISVTMAFWLALFLRN